MTKVSHLRSALGIMLLGCPAPLSAGQVDSLVQAPPAAEAASFVEEAGSRVVGGKDAEPNRWPFQAFVRLYDPKDPGPSWMCGGTLISREWVMTAAHCFFGDQKGRRQVESMRIGSLIYNSGGIVTTAAEVRVHPKFDADSLENDIALIRLARPVDLPNVKLADYARSEEDEGNGPMATILGWGRTAEGRTSVVLQEAELPLVPAATCNGTLKRMAGFARYGAIDSRRVCAGLSEGGVDSCSGDSGGPLLRRASSGWLQVGIVSFGTTRCGRPGTYGVYTRVAAFIDWVQSIIDGGASSGKPILQPVKPTNKPVPPLSIGVSGKAPKLFAAAARPSRLQLRMSRQDLRIGDRFELSITSPVDGYLLLFDESNDGRVTQLFPNQRSQLAGRDGRLRAGAPLRIPDASYGFALRASEPRGRGRIIAYVSTRKSGMGRTAAVDGFRPIADAEDWLGEIDAALDEAEDLSSARAAPASGRNGWIAANINYVVR